MQIGESVLITDGPFAGLAGRFAELSGRRVIIMMQLESHQVHVEMDIDWVTARAPLRKTVTRIRTSGVELPRSGQA